MSFFMGNLLYCYYFFFLISEDVIGARRPTDQFENHLLDRSVSSLSAEDSDFGMFYDITLLIISQY